MATTPARLNPPKRLLLGPGPSDVSPRVRAALGAPLVGHLDPYFLQIMNDTQAMLRQLFRTENRMTLAISGTGSAGMETCLANLLEPGDKVLVAVNGVFGGRMAEVAGRCGAEVAMIVQTWGKVFPLEQIEEALVTHRPKVFAIVHAETSTGALQPMEGISQLCRATDTLLVVDTVTSLGGVPVEIDAWGVDAVYSGTQKCLSCPPGLAPVSFSERALEVITHRRHKVQSWYLDINLLANYWGSERVYHHTAPISMNYGLYETLLEIHEEGLEARWKRHLLHHGALKAGLAALGIEFAADPDHLLPTLNAVIIPSGVDDLSVRKQLLGEFGIEIGGGLGDYKGKAWRIGLMGQGSRMPNVLLLLAALEQLLGAKSGAVAAANEVYSAG